MVVNRCDSLINLIIFVSLFFFQAEDGIRDLVRSRGLGDVYKRQSIIYIKGRILYGLSHAKDDIRKLDKAIIVEGYMAVSYTHLTLPTSDLV